MRTLLTSLLLSLVLFTPLITEGGVSIPNPLEAENFTDLLKLIIDFIFTLAVGVAPIMIIVSGFYFVTAAGDPEKIMLAKKIVLWTLIGLLVVLSAKGLIKLFKEVFEVEEGWMFPAYFIS